MPTRKKKKRLITADDLASIVFVGDPQVSPDGSEIVFVHKTFGSKNDSVTNLWRISTGGGDAASFTSGGRDGQPRYAPDGSQIAFVRSAEPGCPQIYLVPTSGGEARKLTELPQGTIGAIRWSPTGKQIAMSYRKLDDKWTNEAKKEREAKGLSDPPREIDDWWYRLDGDGYFDADRFELYVVDVETGAHTLLYDKDTLGDFTFDYSPDGSQLAVTTNRDKKAMIRPERAEIIRINVKTKKITPIKGLPDGPKHFVRWSPDGKRLAYAGREGTDGEYSTENLELWVCDAVKGGGKCLSGREDYCLLAVALSDTAEAAFGPNLGWSKDSKHVYVQLGWHGETHIASIPARGGRFTFHTSGAAANRMGNVSAKGDVMPLTIGTWNSPGEIAVARVSRSGFEVTTLTSVNKALLSQIDLARPKSKWIRAEDGHRVQVWTMDPPQRSARSKRPAVLEIHGGPHAQYGVEFFHEFQVLAAEGYVVAYSNPRGSKGYGRDHCASIRGNWGSTDWIDIQAVIAYMQSLPNVDTKRMGCMGGSYGGYMTNWAIGHCHDFKAAITDRCVSNLHSMFGTSDYYNKPDGYFPGNSWDNPEPLWDQSPLKYFGNVKTPTLIIHSEGDLRCNVAQADEVFAALKLRNIPTRYVRYPRSTSHGMSRNGPLDMRLHRLGEINAWWKKYLS